MVCVCASQLGFFESSVDVVPDKHRNVKRRPQIYASAQNWHFERIGFPIIGSINSAFICIG